MIPQCACDLGHERHPQAPSWAEESVEAQRRRNRSRIINNVNAAGPGASSVYDDIRANSPRVSLALTTVDHPEPDAHLA